MYTFLFTVSLSKPLKEKYKQIYVVGDCKELGSWKYENSVKLTKMEGKPTFWKIRIELQKPTVNYRYFVATHYSRFTDIRIGDKLNDKTLDKTGSLINDVMQSNSSTKSSVSTINNEQTYNEDIMIETWETHIVPRLFEYEGAEMPNAIIQIPLSNYGYQDDDYKLDDGWLTNQTEIRLTLFEESIYIWDKDKHSDISYKIKCKVMDMRHHVIVLSQEATQKNDISNGILVSNLKSDDSSFKEQSEFGTEITEDDCIIFKTRTFQSNSIGFQFEIFQLHEDKNKPPILVGISYLLPADVRVEYRHTLPVTIKNSPIGELTLEAKLIKSMNIASSMEHSFQMYWNIKKDPITVGHRGIGITYDDNEVNQLSSTTSLTRENTIQSFNTAIDLGLPFVEFDVQLSKDRVPVVYHDFKVCVTMKKKNQDMEFLSLPIWELDMRQLLKLRLDHISEEKNNPTEKKYSSTIMESSNTDNDPFPKLKDCLADIRLKAGVFIEFKFPMQLLTGEMESDLDKYPISLNKYVDCILKEIMSFGADRRILLASFEPTICTMIRLKQNKYPVFLLCQGSTEIYPELLDCRARDIQTSINYAVAERFLGISNLVDLNMRNPSLIDEIHQKKLIAMAWGDNTADKRLCRDLISKGMNAIICDGVEKQYKNEIFILEESQSLTHLKK